MPNLYVYGDSFAVDWKEPWVWIRQFAERMRVDNCYVQACAGTNNEWILKTFRDDQHKPGDIVLMFLTEPSRYWFYKDKPYLSNLASILETQDAKDIKRTDRGKFDAIIGYYEHLHREDLSDFRLQMMTDFIRVKSIEREIHLQVIPCFTMNIDWTDLNPCRGNMTFSVCDREFADYNEMPLWYSQSIDTRANHMTLENHSIFANKLYTRFTQGGALDLDTGFETGFLRLSDKLTHPGLCPELVQMAMEPGNSIAKEHFPPKKSPTI